MAHDLDRPAQLLWHADPVEAPRDWSGAEAFPALRQALEAAVERIHEGPWIRVDGRVLPPSEVDDLWKETFRSRSD